MAQEKHETHRFRAMLFLLAAGCLLLPGAAAADIDRLTESCQVCHGPDGVSRWPDIPNISGLPEIVIANALYPATDNDEPGDDPSERLWRDRRTINVSQLERLDAVWAGPLAEIPLLPIDPGPALVGAVARQIESQLRSA